MMNNLAYSIDRAIKLMGTPPDYDKYTSIKIESLKATSCFCFHCLPNTWQSINAYIHPYGPIEDEGDVLLKENDKSFVLECHESGPEIIIYGVASSLIGAAIAKLVTMFLTSLRDDHKSLGALKVTLRRQVKNEVDEEIIVKVDMPLSGEVVKQLNNRIIKAIEKEVESSE